MRGGFEIGSGLEKIRFVLDTLQPTRNFPFHGASFANLRKFSKRCANLAEKLNEGKYMNKLHLA